MNRRTFLKAVAGLPMLSLLAMPSTKAKASVEEIVAAAERKAVDPPSEYIPSAIQRGVNGPIPT